MVKLRRQINDLRGQPQAGAEYTIRNAVTNAVVVTGTTGADGWIDVDLPNGVIYDIETILSGDVWHVRGRNATQLAELDVTGLLRLPRLTTTERNALGLGATDAGAQIYNTTTNQEETWGGASWEAGGGGTTTDPGGNQGRRVASANAAQNASLSDPSLFGVIDIRPDGQLGISRAARGIMPVLAVSNIAVSAGVVYSIGVFENLRLHAQNTIPTYVPGDKVRVRFASNLWGFHKTEGDVIGLVIGGNARTGLYDVSLDLWAPFMQTIIPGPAGTPGPSVRTLTQAAYDALASKDANTFYVISG